MNLNELNELVLRKKRSCVAVLKQNWLRFIAEFSSCFSTKTKFNLKFYCFASSSLYFSRILSTLTQALLSLSLTLSLFLFHSSSLTHSLRNHLIYTYFSVLDSLLLSKCVRGRESKQLRKREKGERQTERETD